MFHSVVPQPIKPVHALPEKYAMKHVWFFHEMLNCPYEMYHESQFMVYHGLFHGP